MLKLTDREWKGFKLSEIMRISNGKRLESYNRSGGHIPYAGASDSNNGITDFVSNVNESTDGNTLGVNYNGSVCESFYHPYDCTFSDDVKHLHLKNYPDGEDILLFFANSIVQQKVKYAYSYKFNGKRMDGQMIYLPVNEHGNPDYQFMERYIKEAKERKIAKVTAFIQSKLSTIRHKDIPAPEEKKWAEFLLTDIFLIHSTSSGIDGIRLNKGKGNEPYITRSDKNNGVNGFYGIQQHMEKDDGNVIAVGLDTQTATYQPQEFYTGQNIQIFHNDHLNEYVAGFMIAALRKTLASFSWGGHGATIGRLNRSYILLPVGSDGEPDYEYMEQYAKNITIRKYNDYLELISAR